MSDLLSEVDKLMTAVRNQEDYDFAVAEKMALLDLQNYGFTDEVINEVRQKIEEKYFTRLSFQALLHLYKVILKQDPVETLKKRMSEKANIEIVGDIFRGSMDRAAVSVREGVQVRDDQLESFEQVWVPRRERMKGRRRHKKTLRD